MRTGDVEREAESSCDEARSSGIWSRAASAECPGDAEVDDVDGGVDAQADAEAVLFRVALRTLEWSIAGAGAGAPSYCWPLTADAPMMLGLFRGDDVKDVGEMSTDCCWLLAASWV